ncbi:MAG: FAD-dependent oxidoreductase [bacterium]|nr:FAD-dependent oxidoreductase [bacterium]
MAQADVTIVGGGLSGLTCARVLHQAGIHFHLLEASDQIGGRVKTHHLKGFLLDHGFQVYLSAYEEPKRWIDIQSLQLKSFLPGALIRRNGSFFRFIDPFRNPLSAFQTLLSPIGSIGDKVRISKLKSKLLETKNEDIFLKPSYSTIEYLKREGFSENIIEAFFRPFFGGVFLEKELRTNSQIFEYLFKLFSKSEVSVPEMGMGMIPIKLAECLPAELVRLNSKVVKLDGTSITLQNGETWNSKIVVIATDLKNAAMLLQQDSRHIATTESVHLYFAANEPPVLDPILILNGEGRGLVNNVAVMSQVSPNYAPSGEALISVTVIGHTKIDKEIIKQQVRQELQEWFGKQVNVWRSLAIFTIENAHPLQLPVLQPLKFTPQEPYQNVFICGDYCNISSINGAMTSGRQVGEMVLHRLGVQMPSN